MKTKVATRTARFKVLRSQYEKKHEQQGTTVNIKQETAFETII
ncbi:uncharacterized protein G2W53_027645 [Senna tora]|uniref:Uncharacterized protein n=1 Tax=Senna tora TaxID=362788 RepID=A0A834TJM4_9FABA|nr:uncharacterized protein G2W53_027645 [Senna tora]